MANLDPTNSISGFSAESKANILAEALPYIRCLYGKTIIVKYGGNAMTEEYLKLSFASDLVLMKSIGIYPVVVHGGGPQINNALRKIGKQGVFTQGIRITDKETMEVVQWVLCGEVQQDIVMAINNCGGKAVGLTGKDGGLIRASRYFMPDQENPGKVIDIGFVGKIKSVDPTLIKALHDADFIPIISPIGFDANGQSYNINADIVSGKIAEALNAEKLIMMTNITGVQDKQGRLLNNLSEQDADRISRDGTISDGMLPKILSALDAVKSGVNAAHIIDGRILHSVLIELLTEKKLGTIIHSHKISIRG